jgi:hypothetical protein
MKPQQRGSAIQRDGGVPRISEFFGISIYMYWGDHGPPHFHARYSGHKASISIGGLSVLAGSLPPRALGLVMEWAALHERDLRAAWDRAAKNEAPGTIAPLE